MINDRLHSKEVLHRFGKRVVSRSRANLTRDGRKGRLYDSLEFELDVFKNSISLGFSMNDYGEFIDQGVSGTKRKFNTRFSFRDKMPPRRKMLEIVNRKRMRLRDRTSGKFKKGGQDSLAFLVQRHVFEQGIAPSYFFTKPFESAFKDLPDDLEEAYALDIGDMIQQAFSNGTTN